MDARQDAGLWQCFQSKRRLGRVTANAGVEAGFDAAVRCVVVRRNVSGANAITPSVLGDGGDGGPYFETLSKTHPQEADDRRGWAC